MEHASREHASREHASREHASREHASLDPETRFTKNMNSLPNDMVLVIRDYVLDIDTRIELLMLAISEVDQDASPITLFRKFTAKQLQAILDSCRHQMFEPNGQAFTERMASVLPPGISYRHGYTPYPLTTTPYYTDYVVPHPIQDKLGHYSLFTNFRTQKLKRATALFGFTNLLMYTKVNHAPFDTTIRTMAYNVLAGSLILYREILKAPIKVHAWQIKYMQQNMNAPV